MFEQILQFTASFGEQGGQEGLQVVFFHVFLGPVERNILILFICSIFKCFLGERPAAFQRLVIPRTDPGFPTCTFSDGWLPAVSPILAAEPQFAVGPQKQQTIELYSHL